MKIDLPMRRMNTEEKPEKNSKNTEALLNKLMEMVMNISPEHADKIKKHQDKEQC